MDPKITVYDQLNIYGFFFFPFSQKIDIGNIAQLTFHTVHDENCAYGSYERKCDLPFFSVKVDSVLIP